jgi:hypothetical protein
VLHRNSAGTAVDMQESGIATRDQAIDFYVKHLSGDFLARGLRSSN